jgi:xanthine dehydrogenase accessory factor
LEIDTAMTSHPDDARLSNGHILRLDTSFEAVADRLAWLSEPCVLATIVSTSGSTYQKAGSRMLIESNGRFTGLLSGGCLERDIFDHALRVLATGISRCFEYDSRGEDDLVFGMGVGCQGVMRVLLEPIVPGNAASAAVSAALERVRAGVPVALATVFSGNPPELGSRICTSQERSGPESALFSACREAVVQRESRVIRWDSGDRDTEAWIQFLAPPPHILVCGAGPDAEFVVSQLLALRFTVTVTEHRPVYNEPARFRGAAFSFGPPANLGERVNLGICFFAVVMSHHLSSDASYLEVLAKSTAAHVGLLGPIMRRDKLLTAIGDAADLLAPRLRGPVGLDIGAVTPEAIALSIVAQIYSVAAGNQPHVHGLHDEQPYAHPD